MTPLKYILYSLVTAGLGAQRLGTGHGTPSVVIFKPDRIGDFVLASGTIRLCADIFRDCRLTLVVCPLVAPLARQEFPNIEVIEVPRAGDHLRGGLVSGFFTARRALRGVNVKALISLRHHPTLYEDLLLRGLSQGTSYGCARTEYGGNQDFAQFRRFQATQEFSYPQTNGHSPQPLELEAHRRLAELVSSERVSLAEITPRLQTISVQSNRSLLVLPFSSERIKDYPQHLLAEVVARAGLPLEAEVRICGEASRRAALDGVAVCIAERRPESRIRVVCPASVVGLAEEVAASQCVLTMDSAAAHITTALDKPGVILLGGGHFGMFGPWQRSHRQRWVTNPVDCYHCDWRCKHENPVCIQGIPPKTVAHHLQEAWDLGGR